jgi:hypothetical protein
VARRTSKPIAVFLGPTLGVDRGRALLDADYYPPARKGDVYRIMTSGVKTIVLIDGVFHSTPSVWQRELLDAIKDGIKVLGASSMGALRAAELHHFGMIGYGVIFEWYRDGFIDGDDEVALWHGPKEYGFRPLSEPLVNIRYTLLKAVEDNLLTLAQAQDLTAYARKLYYPKRSFEELLNSQIVKGWPSHQSARLKHYFLTKSVDLKQRDAIDVLRHCAVRGQRLRPGPIPKSLRQSFQTDNSVGWEHSRRLELSGFNTSDGAVAVTGEEVLNEAYKDSALVETMWPILSRRYFLLEWARQNRVSCPKNFLTAFIRRWAREHRITDRTAWLHANGLTLGSCRMLLEERALIHWMTTQGPTHFGLKRSLVLEWARQNGVSLTQSCLNHPGDQTAAALEEWIVRQGPYYFGLDWGFGTALLRELQITGKAGELIEKMARQ